DRSAPMLEATAAAARAAGLANVTTRAMDAEDLTLEPDSFDAAISRNVLMLLGEVDRALAGVRRALRPGGKLAAMVFSVPERNPLHALPAEIARRRRGVPEPGPGEPG